MCFTNLPMSDTGSFFHDFLLRPLRILCGLCVRLPEFLSSAHPTPHMKPITRRTAALLTALGLAAGISVVRDLYAYDHVTGNYVGSLLSLGAITDLSRRWRDGTAAGGPTRTEVLITTSLEREDTFLARTADVYYIDGEDGGLYVPKPPKAADAGTPPVATRNWKVVGP